MTKKFRYFFKYYIFASLMIASLVVPCGALAESKRQIDDSEQFYYARTLYDAGEYKVCIREFSRFIEHYPTSHYIPEAQFKLAQSFLNAGMYKEAASEFDLFARNYPGSVLGADAKKHAREARDRYEADRFVLRSESNINGLAPKLRAAQVMLFESKTEAELGHEIKRMKSAGINAIIVRVFHNQGDRFYGFSKPRANAGVYFQTTHAPVVDDVLGRVIRAARPIGMKVFAWMTTRYADYGVEDDEALSCRAWDIDAQEYVRCKGLDLFNEAAVKRLEGIYSDLAAYDIDGVLFQDDLVLRHNEGFGPEMKARYRRDKGTSIEPTELYLRADKGEPVRYTDKFWQWAAWKNKRLLSVAARLRQVVKKKRPNVRFAINLMYESITNPAGALAWLSQSFDGAIKTGFDYFSIMAYHRQISEELKCDTPTTKRMIDSIVERASGTLKDRARILIKFQTVDWNTGRHLPDNEITGLVRSVKGLSRTSLAVVPYRAGLQFPEIAK